MKAEFEAIAQRLKKIEKRVDTGHTGVEYNKSVIKHEDTVKSSSKGKALNSRTLSARGKSPKRTQSFTNLNVTAAD